MLLPWRLFLRLIFSGVLRPTMNSPYSPADSENHHILGALSTGQLLRLEGPENSALIICRRYYAEFVGPGAAVGGPFDVDCVQLIPIGPIAFHYLDNPLDKIQAFQVRHQWMNLAQKIVLDPVPLKRALAIMLRVQRYCGIEAVAQLPNDLLAQLAGVLPNTVAMARQSLTVELPGDQLRDELTDFADMAEDVVFAM